MTKKILFKCKYCEKEWAVTVSEKARVSATQKCPYCNKNNENAIKPYSFFEEQGKKK